jgi:hypothetical protein
MQYLKGRTSKIFVLIVIAEGITFGFKLLSDKALFVPVV